MESVIEPDRVLGTLYGVAIGDAMGMPATFLSRSEIKLKYGIINDFLEAPIEGSVHSKMVRGQYTDDTELTIALARAIVRARRVDPYAVADELLKWADEHDILNTTLIGPSTRAAIEGLRKGISCTVTGRKGSTNGCAMKIAPVAIFDALASDSRTVEDVINACMPTHHTAIAVSGASALCFALKECLRGERDTDKIVNAALLGAQKGARAMGEPQFSIETRIREAVSLSRENDFDIFLDNLYKFFIEPQGALTEDAVPAAIAIFVHSHGNFHDTVIEGSNLGGDSDTICSMAGGLAGASCGLSMIPAEWVKVIDSSSAVDIRELGRELLNVL